ncbi:MAG TPA: YggS family pyridoxal phosphate-dependent enzyme, partial [Myxococcaceae bacterium]
MSDVAAGWKAVLERVRAAEARAGRPAGSVEVVAVSKLQPPEAIRAAHAAGARAFGENYAQELRDKAEALSDLQGLRWHAIGPLQTNKARYVARSAHVFHALDRLEVAQELSRRRTGTPLSVYVEVNVAGEASKTGVAPEALPALLEAVRPLSGLELAGLMTMPPLAPA